MCPNALDYRPNPKPRTSRRRIVKTVIVCAILILSAALVWELLSELVVHFMRSGESNRPGMFNTVWQWVCRKVSGV